MTAKDKLRQAIEDLSEPDAEEILTIVVRRTGRDPVAELFEDAPEDDEPSTPEENASADEAWAQRHDSVPLSEIERERG